MEIWNIWTSLITNGMEFISIHLGVSEALAIVLFTLFARFMLMPISIKSAYKMHMNKLAINKVKPEIDRLKDLYGDNPAELAKRTMAIYKKNGIKLLDKTTAINVGSQGILGLGIFQAIRNMTFNSKFMWIADIAKPDVILAFLVGLLTFFSMQMMPGSAEQHSLIIYLIPAMVSAFVLIGFPSALGLYWATSNLVTIFQALILRAIFTRNSYYPNGA